jgi:polysaccharide export outer membrane protein
MERGPVKAAPWSRDFRRAAFALSAGLLAVATTGAGPAWAADKPSAPPPAAPQAPPIADYRIGPLDVLDIAAPSVPDLTRTVRVSGAGEISLPFVGVIKASGRTALELQQDIAERLAQYVKDPEVSVFVKEFTSERVTVEGEVNQPGIYPIVGKTTLLQVLALARGTSPIAKLARVTVYREIDGQRSASIYNIDAIRVGREADPEILGNDLVEVDTSRTKSLFRDLITAVPLVAILRPY